MRLIQRADAFDGRDLACRYRVDRRDAGTHRPTVDEHGAGAALRQPAAELRAIELEVVAKHVKQRRVRLGRNRTAHAIDFDVDGHAWRLPRPPARRPTSVAFSSLDRFYSAPMRAPRRAPVGAARLRGRL